MMALLGQVKQSVRAAFQSADVASAFSLRALLQLELSQELARLQKLTREETPRNPAGHGFKVYSQADEDGILAAVLKRLELAAGTFVEIGCGDGRENNTHLLLLNGWRGVWVDGNKRNIDAIRAALPPSPRLHALQAYVTRDNVGSLLQPALAAYGSIDLLSVDVDGNDLPITQSALKILSPRVVVVEYNAKFPYPMNVSVSYDPDHRWQYDDYHGASLAAWVEGMGDDYSLISCNLAGTNAFFVRRADALLFGNHAPELLYQPTRFHLTAMQAGHPPTLKFLAAMFARENTGGRR